MRLFTNYNNKLFSSLTKKSKLFYLHKRYYPAEGNLTVLLTRIETLLGKNIIVKKYLAWISFKIEFLVPKQDH